MCRPSDTQVAPTPAEDGLRTPMAPLPDGPRAAAVPCVARASVYLGTAAPADLLNWD